MMKIKIIVDYIIGKIFNILIFNVRLKWWFSVDKGKI